MKAIIYTFHLLDPVLIAQPGAGEENSATSLPYIPGSALRGAMAARWQRQNPEVDDLAVDLGFRSIFLDGDVAFLNAYPLLKGKRTLPRPASWMIEKEMADVTGVPIFDFAVDGSTQLESPKAPDRTFCLIEEEEPEEGSYDKSFITSLISPTFFEQLHITLEKVNRRDDQNTIFRYDALNAGQRFVGVIVGTDDVDLSKVQELFSEDELILGSAQMAGYGRMAVEDLREVSDWCEAPSYERYDPDRVIVTLLSPAILRNGGGNAGWDGGKALSIALGMAPGSQPTAAFGQLELVGGYNRKWNLPLPQEWALAAGSVFVFAVQDVDMAQLQLAVDTGVGERRAEGFGRVAVDWQAGAQMKQQGVEAEKPDTPTLSEESKSLAQSMVQRRLRLILDARLVEQVNRNAGNLRRLPQNSQLAAIRQATLPALAGGAPQDGLQALADHLNNLKKTGRSQLERARLGNQSLFQWLNERVAGLDVQEQLLQSQAPPVVAGQKAAIDQALRQEYTARLIDGMMQLAARRNTERKP